MGRLFRAIVGAAVNQKPPASGDQGGVISVRAQGLTYADRSIQIGMLIVAPLAALEIILLTNGGPSRDTFGKIGLFLLTISAYELITEGLASVRRVDIDSMGVRFRYLFHSERGVWADLRPGRSPARHGMWMVVRDRGVSRRRRGHWVTWAQAQAILRYPARPRWDFRPGVPESLELPSQSQ